MKTTSRSDFERCDDPSCAGCPMAEAIYLAKVAGMRPETVVEMFFEMLGDEYDMDFTHDITKHELH